MNFQQLKIIREAARCEFNLTEVANTLFTSQSGVSGTFVIWKMNWVLRSLSVAASVCWG